MKTGMFLRALWLRVAFRSPKLCLKKTSKKENIRKELSDEAFSKNGHRFCRQVWRQTCIPDIKRCLKRSINAARMMGDDAKEERKYVTSQRQEVRIICLKYVHWALDPVLKRTLRIFFCMPFLVSSQIQGLSTETRAADASCQKTTAF